MRLSRIVSSLRARRIDVAIGLKTSGKEAVLANADMKIAPRRNVVEIEIVPAALSMIVGNGIGLTIPVGAPPAAPTFAPDPPSSNGTADDEAIRVAPAYA